MKRIAKIFFIFSLISIQINANEVKFLKLVSSLKNDLDIESTNKVKDSEYITKQTLIKDNHCSFTLQKENIGITLIDKKYNSKITYGATKVLRKFNLRDLNPNSISENMDLRKGNIVIFTDNLKNEIKYYEYFIEPKKRWYCTKSNSENFVNMYLISSSECLLEYKYNSVRIYNYKRNQRSEVIKNLKKLIKICKVKDLS